MVFQMNAASELIYLLTWVEGYSLSTTECCFVETGNARDEVSKLESRCHGLHEGNLQQITYLLIQELQLL